MTRPWRDPRTGMLMLRKRVPTRYRSVAGVKGDTVKISTGTKDDREAAKRWPDVLRQWAEREAEWERKLNVVAATPEKAAEIAARWAASLAGGATLDTGGETSDIFEPLDLAEERKPERLAQMWDRVEKHAQEALRVAGVEVSPETWPVLVQGMARVVQAAYLQNDLAALGMTEARAVRPLDAVREVLPSVPDIPAPAKVEPRREVSLRGLYAAWKAVATVKPRVANDTGYIVEQLAEFAGDDDATRITRDDLLRWRDATKSAGIGNNTWNNRLSMIRQVFARAVADGKLPSNPTDQLRLPKARGAQRLPYSDADAALILNAARIEASPALRWAHWVMAFTGMRVGEVLQLTGADIRQDGGIPYIAIHEDDAGKSVKNSERRNVPIHRALIAEGFLDYARSVAPSDPLFPDKRPDRFGQRGGRGWNLVGKWVRDTVGITDQRYGPDHSWRHRLEDELRAAAVPEEVRDAIAGHARKTTGRVYGVRGVALSRLHRALSKVSLPPGVEPRGMIEARLGPSAAAGQAGGR
jgi:integrase